MLQRIPIVILLIVGLITHNNTFAAEEVNRLGLPQKIETEKGTTELLLPILLTNAEEITGFQCDLYLPDGFIVATDEYDDYQIEVARTTTRRHSLAIRQMSDGALRIVLSSVSNATFSGNSGAVLNITVAIDNNVEVGNYDVNLKNIVLTDPQAVRYTSADVSGTIVVKANNYIMGDVNGDGEADLSDAIMVTYYSLHEVPSNFNEAAADMNGDGEIDLSDAIIIIYKSLGVK